MMVKKRTILILLALTGAILFISSGKIDDLLIIKTLRKEGLKIPYTIKRLYKEEKYTTFNGDGQTSIVYELPNSFVKTFDCSKYKRFEEYYIPSEKYYPQYLDSTKLFCIHTKNEKGSNSKSIIQGKYLIVEWVLF